jgi:hypothetical protein
MVHDDKTVGYVHQAIMLGWPRAQVNAWAATQEPPVPAAALDRAYAQCVEAWIAAANAPDGELFALHVARREDLYRRAMAAGDLALGHKILVDQAKLQQQYRTEQRAAKARDEASELVERIKARQPSLRSVR